MDVQISRGFAPTERAEALYRRSGFETTGYGALGPLRHLFGFDRYATMRRPLA